MKHLKKGHTTVLVDEQGHPRDATGHRTDLKPVYSPAGFRLWRAEELAYVLGERVRATKAHPRMALGELGTIMNVPEFYYREYYVLPDSLMRQFFKQHSGLYLARMKEHWLQRE